MTLLLMAAGSGSRYGKLKQFDALGPSGEFLLEFSIYDALHFGFTHIVVVTKAANQKFLKDYLSSRLPKTIKLDVIVQDIHDLPNDMTLKTERKKPWGTAHAVWCAREVITSNFVILNADDYYGKNAFKGAAHFIATNASSTTYAIVGYQLKDTLSEHGSVSRGVCKVKDHKLLSIKEHTKIEALNNTIIDVDTDSVLNPNSIVSMNFWICSPSIFNYIETYFEDFLEEDTNLEKNEMYLPFVAQEMMSHGLIKIHVINAKSNWFGVTYYDDKINAVHTLAKVTQSGDYPLPLW